MFENISNHSNLLFENKKVKFFAPNNSYSDSYLSPVVDECSDHLCACPPAVIVSEHKVIGAGTGRTASAEYLGKKKERYLWWL